MFYRGTIVIVDKKEIGMDPVGTLGTLGTAVALFGLDTVLGKNT